MVYSLAYTRPPHVDDSRGSLSGQEKQRSINESITASSTCSMSCGIPDALSFDKIIDGGTCPVRCSMSLSTHHCPLLTLSTTARHSSRLPELPEVYRACCREPTVLPLVSQLRPQVRPAAAEREGSISRMDHVASRVRGSGRPVTDSPDEGQRRHCRRTKGHRPRVDAAYWRDREEQPLLHPSPHSVRRDQTRRHLHRRQQQRLQLLWHRLDVRNDQQRQHQEEGRRCLRRRWPQVAAV